MRYEVVVGWALPTINAVTLRARGANHLSPTNRNGGQCPPYNHFSVSVRLETAPTEYAGISIALAIDCLIRIQDLIVTFVKNAR